jgi:hypothetical protein
VDACAPPVALYALQVALLAALMACAWLAGVAWNRGKVVEGIERRAVLERLARGKLEARAMKASPRRVGFRPPAR